jgi:ABC-2 type transport system permease protein
VVLAAFAVAVAGYSALFSALSNSRGRAAGLAAGLTVLFYVAWVIAGLSDRWSWLKHVSIFAAYQPQSALETGTVPGPGTAVLFAVGLVCAIVALVIFQRRDVIT